MLKVYMSVLNLNQYQFYGKRERNRTAGALCDLDGATGGGAPGTTRGVSVTVSGIASWFSAAGGREMELMSWRGNGGRRWQGAGGPGQEGIWV